MKQNATIPTYGIIVDPNAPKHHNPALTAGQGPHGNAVIENKPVEQGPTASHLNIPMDQGATRSCTVPRTIDLDQELVCPKVLCRSERPNTPTQSLPAQARQGDHAMKNSLVEEDIERACLVADGPCMACDEPVHLAIIPSDRSAFVHRNKALKDRLLLVRLKQSSMEQHGYGVHRFPLHHHV